MKFLSGWIDCERRSPIYWQSNNRKATVYTENYLIELNNGERRNSHETTVARLTIIHRTRHPFDLSRRITDFMSDLSEAPKFNIGYTNRVTAWDETRHTPGVCVGFFDERDAFQFYLAWQDNAPF